MVRNSAAGTAIQTPVIPRTGGSVKRQIAVNTNVLAKEIMADIVPLESAVKMPEDVILIPLNKKATANILKPEAASSKVALSSVKTETIGVAARMEINIKMTDETMTNRIEIL